MSSLQCWNAPLARARQIGLPLVLLLGTLGSANELACAAAPPMRFERLGLDDGLSQQAVLAIAQDSTGFMWFGTEDGLDRYDGYSFRHLRQARLRAHGLPDNFVTDVQLDPAGRLWIATDGAGVARRVAEETEFRSILTDTAPNAVRGLEYVRAIRFDPTGRLWIGARSGGLAAFDPTQGRIERFRHDDADSGSLGDDSIFAVLPDRGAAVWVGTQSGLDRLDLATRRFQHIVLQPGAPVRVRALAADTGGILWIGTDTGLVRLDTTNGAQQRYTHDPAQPRSLPSDRVQVLHIDEYGRLWIGTADGLALLDRDANAFDNYRNDPADPASLPDNTILTLHEDRTGLLWIGTRFGGVGRWNPRTWVFGHHAAGAEEGMASRNIMAFTEDAAGRLWVASFGGGIAIVDPLAPDAETHPLTLRRAKHSLSDDRVMALLTDATGMVWAGTMDGGLDRIDPRTLAVKVFQHDAADPGSLSAPGVMSLLEDSARRFWVGTYGGGLSRLDRATGRCQRYLPDPADPGSLSAARVTALAEDPTGRLWVGTDGGGLNILDPQTGRFFHLQHDARPGSLSSATVYSIYVDPTGTVWVGTRTGGLDRVVGSALAPEAIHFDNFADHNGTDRSGLPNNTIYGIHADSAGRLWLSTNHGLARFDPAAETVRSFHRMHGLQEEEFNFGAHYASRTGRLFFGGAKGYNVFDPAQVVFDTAAPPVALTGAFELGKPLMRAGQLAMPTFHYRDVVSFEFAALDFAAPRANSFAFKLEGFDRDWEYAGTRRTVTYTNLPGGHYTLRVRAANSDGVWGDRALELPLDVDPAPWLSRWAYVGYILLGAAVIYLCWLGHRRSLEREERYSLRLKQEVTDRTRELAARNVELEMVNSRLEQASLTDPLTGLGNRRSLIKDMPRLLSQVEASQRTGNPQRLSLMLVDLDRLKPINDEHGHEAGDLALEGVATLLRRAARESDRVVRWGGDEFVIVRTLSGLDDAAQLAEEIRARTAELRFRVSDSASTHTTCSIGFACYPFILEAPLWTTWEEVLNLADMALYRAKILRDAWLGWCGLPRAARQTELFRLMSVDPHTAVRAGYIDVRASRRKDPGDHSENDSEDIDIPTRRLSSL